MSKADLLATPPDYLQTFSLKCEPFANDLDGRFFYGGTALMQRLDLLTHLTQFGDSVVLVSGPPGSGKTTLLGRFAGQANKQWRLCLINADEFEQFRQRLADTLRIGESDNEQQMLEQWISQTDNSQLLVIVIDNAEELPESAFETLCTLLNQPFSERIRLILFGTPEAQQTLKRSLDQKNLKCTSQLLEVPRLSEEETASYLMYRLAVAGYSGESPFTATEVRGMCKAADGRPAEINQLAHDSLLEHQARARSKRQKPKKAGRRFGAAVWGPASLLVIGAAVYLGWERLQPALQPPTDADRQAQTGTPIPLDLPAPAAKPTAADSGTPAPITRKAKAPVTAAPAEVDTAPPAEAPAPVAVVTTPPPATLTPQTPVPVAPATPAPEVASETAAAEVTSTTAAPAAAETPLAAAPEPVPAVVVPETAVAADDAATASADTATPTPAAPPETTADAMDTDSVATAGTPAAESPPAAAETAGPHREAWLLQQDEKAVGLQLLGSRSEKSINDYIKRHKFDPDEVAYYRGNFRGGEWFVLIYGSYADKTAALKARNQLPAKIRKDKPWPRTYQSIQKSIREMQ